MKKTKRLWSWALAGALAVSNLSVVVAPVTSIVAQAAAVPTGQKISDIDPTAATENKTATVLAGKTTSIRVYVSAEASDAADKVITELAVGAPAGTGAAAITVGTPKKYTDDNLVWYVDLAIDGSLSKKLSNTSATINIAAKNATGVCADAEDFTINIAGQDSLDETSVITFIKTDANGNLISASSDTIYTPTANVAGKVELGTTSGGEIYELATASQTGYVSTIPTSVSAAAPGTRYVKYTSSDESIFTVATDGTELTYQPSIVVKKPGTANLNVEFAYLAAGATKMHKSSTSITLNVIVQPTSINGFYTDSNGINKSYSTPLALNKDQKSFELKAELVNANSLAVDENAIVWESEDKNILSLSSDSGISTVVSAKGNTTSAGLSVWAYATDSTTYQTYIKAPTAANLASLQADGTAAKEFEFTSDDVVAELTATAEDLDIIIGKKDTSITIGINDTNITRGTTAGDKTIVLTAASDDESIAAVEINKTTGVMTVEGKKAGKTTITVKGVYKVKNSETNILEDTTLTKKINVNVVDPDAKPDEEKKDEEKKPDEKKPDETKPAEEKPAADGSKKDVPAPVNTELKDAAGATFKVTNATAGAAEAQYTAPADKNAKSATIPDTITDASGNVYKVTSIPANAFKGTKATKVTIGANIKNIDPKAFKGSKVKTIVVKGTKLTKKMAKAIVKYVKEGGKVQCKGANKKANKKLLKKQSRAKSGKVKIK